MPFSRTNESNFAYFPRGTRPFTQGAFKKVWRGRYTVGPRKGEICVSKAFIARSFFTDYFDVEMRVINRAQQLIDAWNAARVFNLPVVLNVPEVWTSPENGDRRLVEPFIKNFRKFNSNGGRVFFPDTEWSDALQALSHFSYHSSCGMLLLCDIQGGIYPEGFALSDPAILSQAQSYGPSDLGPAGIYRFFARHWCTRFCNPKWIRPFATGSELLARR